MSGNVWECLGMFGKAWECFGMFSYTVVMFKINEDCLGALIMFMLLDCVGNIESG